MEMIVCDRLTKQFGSVTSVDNVTFSVPDGELFGFLGPNGAGKTTTIKMLTGLLHPTAGTAAIGGHDIRTHPIAAKRILGYIPDNPFLYEKLSGREFLDFMADLYSVQIRDRAGRIENLLHLFGLQSKGDALIQGYSRGMRQKIALAGALIHNPKVIFLDEPTVGLDPGSARDMEGILRELCRRGTTVFVSTHVLDIAERMCDRVGIINEGRLVALGTMEELRSSVRHERALQGAAESDGHPATAAEGSAGQSLEEIFFALTGDTGSEDRLRFLG